MPLPTLFANLTNPTGPELDADLAVLGALTIIPCSVSGTNTLALMPLTSPATPSVPVYQNYICFSGIVANANTAAATVAVGSLAALGVYRDTPAGPVALSGGEQQPNNLCLWLYDSALNGGNGGFHLVTSSLASPYIKTSLQSVAANAGTTLSAINLTGAGLGQSIITRSGTLGGGFNDATDSAANIVAAMPGSIVGSTFKFRVENTTGQTQTLTAGAAVTLVGPVTTAAAASHDYIGVITAIGTPALTVYG